MNTDYTVRSKTRPDEFNLLHTMDLLRRTPEILRVLLSDLPEELVRVNEGPGTWSSFDVVGHLIHGEKTDWIPRARIILEHGEDRAFDPFDREAMLNESKGKACKQLLDEFATLRSKNIEMLQQMNLSQADFARKGKHPALGEVNLGQLLATWVTHDLDHLAQIIRVTGKHFDTFVGPWREYLSVLKDRT